MKKVISMILVLVFAFCVCAFAEEETEHAEYTIYNTTGELVKELYVYEVGSEDKGENLAGEEGLADGSNVVVSFDKTKEDADATTYVLEYTVDGQEPTLFETLHFEETPISLLAADAITGATPIAFAAPEAQ